MSEDIIHIEANNVEMDEDIVKLYFDYDFSKRGKRNTKFILDDIEGGPGIDLMYQFVTVLPEWGFYSGNGFLLTNLLMKPQNDESILFLNSIYDKDIDIDKEIEFVYINNYWVEYNTVVCAGYLPQTTFVKESDVLTINYDIDIENYTEFDPFSGVQRVRGYYTDYDDYRDFNATETLSINNLYVPEGEELEIMEARVVLTGNPDIRGTLRCRELIIEG